jgi:hypothetical protein
MASRGLMSLAAVLISCAVGVADIADFDDLALDPESFWNGSDGSGGFTSGSAYFENFYDTDYENWAGFAYSNITDTASSGWSAQYNAIAGSGQAGSTNYAVAYMDSFNAVNPTLHLYHPQTVDCIYVTNINYAYYSMLEGDLFSKKFGGDSGDDPDWLLLTITGKNADGLITGSVDFYLADYTFEDNGLDYIVDSWRPVDLSALGVVQSLEFTLNSSDIGEWGMNTPAYFALDTVTPEPATFLLLAFGGLLIRRHGKFVD